MKARKRSIFAAILACSALVIVATTQAHNGGYDVPSPGLPGAAITINGVEGGGEWAGAAVFAMADYGMGNPLSASVKALHKADGIYLLAVITDATNNNNDAIQIRFDLNHNGGVSPEVADWGAQILRNNQVTWGPANADPAGWVVAPGGTAAAASGGASWTIEMHLPTTASGTFGGFALGVGIVGIHLELFDADQAFSPNSAKYTQWPQPPALDLNALLDGVPNNWGNYTFDPATTFPNIAVTGVRRGGGVGPENYYNISHTAENTFVVKVKNPGGTAIADATGVRLNLYLGAVGLGEPFHRLDAAATIDGDCPAYNPAASLPQADVCSGGVSLPDIETILLASIPAAKYTIKNGVTRVGGSSIVVTGGTETDIDVLKWTTTDNQDLRFLDDRAHQCMRAEALVPNDPNLSDNTMQVNMNFVCVPGGMAKMFKFGIGLAGFAKYNPGTGADMFIQFDRKNMDKQGWEFKISDTTQQVKQVKDDVYLAALRGTQSIGASLEVHAPRPEALGRTLKENLMVPPKAGGRQSNASVPSGDAPVYVKVNPGSTLLVANYNFHDGDEQNVDLDGDRDLFPPNGPAGLPNALLQRALQQAAEFKLLLAPKAPLGALVGSFDNFKTAFLIAEGAQVKAPANAQFLALGINDAIGLFNDNSGTGFRVKVVERSAGSTGSLQPDLFESSIVPVAYAQQPEERSVIPIGEVMPTLCLNGYEKTGAVRTIGGVKHELYRYIGNVCWGFINVFPPDHSDKVDQGDPFDDKVPGGCGAGGGCGGGKSGNILFPFLLALAGLVAIGRFARRR